MPEQGQRARQPDADRHASADALPVGRQAVIDEVLIRTVYGDVVRGHPGTHCPGDRSYSCTPRPAGPEPRAPVLPNLRRQQRPPSPGRQAPWLCPSRALLRPRHGACAHTACARPTSDRQEEDQGSAAGAAPDGPRESRPSAQRSRACSAQRRADSMISFSKSATRVFPVRRSLWSGWGRLATSKRSLILSHRS